MPILWDEKLRLGDTAIDEQHENIFKQLSILSTAIKEGSCEKEVDEILVYLNNYASSHFSDEERLMTQYRYPDMEEHLQQHDQFKENVSQLLEMVTSSVPTKEVAIKIDAALIRYTINHVRKLDSQLVDFIKSSRASEVSGTG